MKRRLREVQLSTFEGFLGALAQLHEPPPLKLEAWWGGGRVHNSTSKKNLSPKLNTKHSRAADIAVQVAQLPPSQHRPTTVTQANHADDNGLYTPTHVPWKWTAWALGTSISSHFAGSFQHFHVMSYPRNRSPSNLERTSYSSHEPLRRQHRYHCCRGTYPSWV